MDAAVKSEDHTTESDSANLSLRNRFILLSITFSLAIAMLAGLSLVGFQALSGARAYVHGESQWTKAQKSSVISLLDYARTGDEQAYRRALQALEITYGDRRARLTLDSENPDDQAAHEGFLAGRNHRQDIGLMIRLFEHGRHMPLFDTAVTVWERGDALIDELAEAAEQLRTQVMEYGPGSEQVNRQLGHILDLDQQLTQQENDFSAAIGQLSRQVARTLSIVVVLAGLGLILAGSMLTRAMFRNADRSEQALRVSRQRYRALVDQPDVGMWQLDAQGEVTYLNPAMRSLLEIAVDEPVVGRPMNQFVAPEHVERIKQDRRNRATGLKTTSEVELITARGNRREVLVHGAPIMMDDGVLRGHVGTCLDITDRKKAELQLRHQAFHDPLTNLPNRELFMDRLEVALRRCRREKSQVAVLFIDLDRFKIVNDSMGHATGDRLLNEAAHRIAGAVREQDTLARFGGDEFGLIMEDIAEPADVLEPARRVIDALASDFAVQNIKARIGASIGIALSRGEHRSADLLRFSDIAMYVAKRRGGNSWHVFDPGQDAHQGDRLQIENQLWKAADRGELVIHYQPIVDLATGKIQTLEALVRWDHPDKGLIAPVNFIPMAEETGAIVQVSQWVVEQAVRDIQKLDAQFGDRAPRSVAVNISAAEFRFSDPVDRIASIVSRAGLANHRLHFEVTESLLMQDPEAIRRLERHGFPVSIDDFGTGYASLDRVREVRFSAIKIDRAFVMDLVNSEPDQAIIQSIVLLGRRLKMEVIAEGIETPQQAEMLRELGCELGQGYYFSRPRPLEKLIKSGLASNQ